MLRSIILTIHLILALFIIALVLLQKGKGAEAGTGFGAGASGTVFGARGSANFLSHATALLVTLFFVTSLTLAYLAGHRAPPTSILDQQPVATEPAPATSAPETPAAPAPTQAPAADTLPQIPVVPEGAAAPASDTPQDGGSDN